MLARRKLTTQEIASLMHDVERHILPRTLTRKLRQQLSDKILGPIRSDLETVQVVDHPRLIEDLSQNIKDAVQGALVQAGEAVGILCAQSIGERQTQLTLNSFHSAGLAIQTVVSGVPRFLELLNATREPKLASNMFYLKKNCKPHEIRKTLSNHLVHVTLQNLVRDITFFSDKEEEVWYGAFEQLYSNEFRDYEHGLSMTLDQEQLYKYRIPMALIKDKIENAYADVEVVFSPTYVGQVDVFVDTQDIHCPNDAEGLLTFLTIENYLQVFLEDVVKPKLLEIQISGIPRITNYHIRQTQNSEWIVETEGINFMEIIRLPFIDFHRATSTNMWDIYDTFGIEAVREFLIHEFKEVVSADGTFINDAHINLLVDIMTHQGTINSISRYGMKKEQTGVLTRSSFEESLEQFCKAGYTAEREPIQAVSASIMCGKRSHMGTGICTLKVDWDAFCTREK